jgi:hypothetical protein
MYIYLRVIKICVHKLATSFDYRSALNSFTTHVLKPMRSFVPVVLQRQVWQGQPDHHQGLEECGGQQAESGQGLHPGIDFTKHHFGRKVFVKY